MAAALGGCAYAPGPIFGRGGQVADALSDPKRATDAAADAPPPGALEEITPALVRRQHAAQPKDLNAEVKSLFAEPQPYRIGPGDILNIVVWDHPDLVLAPAGSLTTDAVTASPVSNGYNVSPEGLIQFPYLGDFRVAGLTEYEVRNRLTARLGKVFNEPRITVRIQAYRSGRVYVDGSVRLPGLQALNDIPMTLPEAINRAGGFAADADRSSIAISRHGATTRVNLRRLTALGVSPTNILLGNGDLVRVLSRDDTKVYVMGEVSRPIAQQLRDGRLTLNEALGEAGGISTISGDPRQIYVVRSDEGAAPTIFHLDASSPAAYALAEGFELKAHDVVYVDPAPLVRWNRVISLILPSAQAVSLGSSISR
jgi:polysaccharide export outer membrane protein